MFANKLKQACVLLVLLGQTTVLAQSERYGGPAGGYYQPVPTWPVEMFHWQHHCSTALEGALRGWANLVQANGNYLISASQAAILAEQARWLSLDNRQRWVEYRQWLRTVNDTRRQNNIAQKRRVNDSRRNARYRVYRLSNQQLDHGTGYIAWPHVLQAREYRDMRMQLDRCFQQCARYGRSNADAEFEINECVAGLQQRLQGRRHKLERDEYVAAQKFLLGLKYHSQLVRG